MKNAFRVLFISCSKRYELLLKKMVALIFQVSQLLQLRSYSWKFNRETSKNLVGEDGPEWMALLYLPFATVRLLKPTMTNQS
ncbi:hypothetical protein DBR43_09490 [Pedobacter sp. KBW06]|nr:hypothetical protein DBR43_09490 [Pedobacter sp. KBW06]